MAGVSSLGRYECGPQGMASKSGRLHRASINTIRTLKGTGSDFSTSCVLCSCSPGRLRSWQGSLLLPSTRSGTCCLRPSRWFMGARRSSFTRARSRTCQSACRWAAW